MDYKKTLKLQLEQAGQALEFATRSGKPLSQIVKLKKEYERLKALQEVFRP